MMYETLVQVIDLENGRLMDGQNMSENLMLTALDAVTGRKPNFWTSVAAECGIEDEGYLQFLRWYCDDCGIVIEISSAGLQFILMDLPSLIHGNELECSFL